MKRMMGVLVVCSLALAAVACGKKEEQKPAGATTTSSAGGGSAGGLSGTGVKDCDEYLSKLDKCMEKAPAAARTMAIDTAKKAFEGQDKTGLAVSCKAMNDNYKCTN